MAIKLKDETGMIIGAADMRAILTDALCGYNVLAGLEVSEVTQREDSDFDLVLIPASVEAA